MYIYIEIYIYLYTTIPSSPLAQQHKPECTSHGGEQRNRRGTNTSLSTVSKQPDAITYQNQSAEARPVVHGATTAVSHDIALCLC